MAVQKSIHLGDILRALLACSLLYNFMLKGGSDSELSAGIRLGHFQASWALQRGIAIQIPAQHKPWVWLLQDGSGTVSDADTPMALASLTKPLTAMTVRSLAEKNKLALTDHIADLLPLLAEQARDERFIEITVQQLLQHTAGFDRTQSGDPLFDSDGRVLGCEVGVRAAVTGRRLDTAPGEMIRYSNIGYCLLGLVIQQITGQSYESAVQQWVREQDFSNVDVPTLGPSPATAEQSPAVNWHGLGAAGGFFSSARMYAKLIKTELEHVSDIALKPENALFEQSYYGLGWRVWPSKKGLTFTHFGAMPDVFTFAVIYPSNCVSVAFFHGRPINDEVAAVQLKSLLHC